MTLAVPKKLACPSSLAATTFLLAALAALSACGGDNEGTASPSSGAASAAPTFAGSPTPTPPPATTPVGMALTEFIVKPDQTVARPGTVIFNVRNEGTVTHQFVVIRTDVKKQELPRASSGGADESQLNVVAKIDAIPPGQSGSVTIPAEAAKYVLICNLVVNGTSHYLSGMYNDFTVTPNAPSPAPGVPTTAASP